MLISHQLQTDLLQLGDTREVRRILTNKAWKYLTGKLKPAVLGTNGLVVLEGGINEEEFKKLMMEE